MILACLAAVGCATLRRYPPCPPPVSASGYCTQENDEGRLYWLGAKACKCYRSYYHAVGPGSLDQ